MNSPYFCSNHIVQLRSSEPQALQCWSEMMNLGLKAYVACHLKHAHSYLSAALEVGLLRARCLRNEFFSDMHIIKPTEFLIQSYLLQCDFTQAIVTLGKLSRLDQQTPSEEQSSLRKFLCRQFERVESAEKAYFNSHTKQEMPENTYREFAISSVSVH